MEPSNFMEKPLIFLFWIFGSFERQLKIGQILGLFNSSSLILNWKIINEKINAWHDMIPQLYTLLQTWDVTNLPPL